MPAPRPAQSTGGARAAALQAEFNEKKWVWVPDEKEGYLSGWVNKEEDEMGEIVMAGGGEIRRVPLYALSKMNPPKFDRVEDIADLTFLNEASVVHNLRLRYGSGAIYTYSGLFLVAINPYQNLPLYSESIVQQYRNKRRDENPPHIFAVAERAWVNMGEERENQSILITGESGAGKTESTKKVIQYLAAIATDVQAPSASHSRSPSMPASSSYGPFMPTGLPRGSSFKHSITASVSGSPHLTAKGRLGLLERQILQANPILEAFGNAQTQRNNNSSRFGKFVRISFAPDGSIAGASIDWYLLEKSRVVVRSDAERSFHAFYQLLTGGGALRDTLLLEGGVENYEYLNKSRREIDGIDDKEEWQVLKNALDVVGFTEAEQLDLFRIVAAVLHIGNITVTSSRSDDAFMPNPSEAEKVCYLLGVPLSEFTRAVLCPRVLAGREWVTQTRTKQQAVDELAALCKTLYEKSFGSLVDRINRALDRPSSKSTFIGVLDIAGFEIFETNAYEQLLINYTNEKLQQFFNHHMFVLEQEEYSREGIQWDYVNFGLDLQPTIDLLEASGTVIGILSCLDEECIMPKATDLTFTNKLHHLWSADVHRGEDPHPGRDKYEPSRFEQGFIVQHYAGKVEYRTDGWLEKNKDPLNDNLTRVLAVASERYVSSLFSDYSDTSLMLNGGTVGLNSGKKRIIKKGAFRTVAQRHKEQLSSLMAQLQATQPHFVRCIVPNANKKPARVDVPLVLDQLRCNGVLEGIRIARLGYPNRLPFVEFRQRYEVLTPGIIPRGYMDGRRACSLMVDALGLDHSIYKVGTSKIFFKAGVLADLEERRDTLLFEIISKIQAMARMRMARRQMKKILNRAIAIRTIQRNARVYGELREWPWWQLYTKVRPLLAATRNDEELRRKEAELTLIRERAERDKQEREAVEKLKMSLEIEKRKIEDDLKAERALALDKDELLARSKKRESELEDEIVALQADIDNLDSQLDRALKLQKASEEKYESLRAAFDEAAGHLVRLEDEQRERGSRDVEISDRLEEVDKECSTLRQERNELQRSGEELQSLVSRLEQDLIRAKEHMDIATADLEGRLDVEQRNRGILKGKADGLEQDARQAKEQLAEMARVATDYTKIIQMKEKEIAALISDLRSSKAEGERFLKHNTELKTRIETLTTELVAQKGDQERNINAQTKLREELDELRALMEAKTSEESRWNEVEKSKEEELAELRGQVIKLQEELGNARRLGSEGQRKLKVDLDNTRRDHQSLLQSHNSLSEKERACQSKLVTAQASLNELEKAKRALESEAQALRSRQHDNESQLAEAQRAKEGLERQLAAAQGRYLNYEEVVIQLEGDKSARDRQLDAARKELDAEVKKRRQLEKSVSNQKAELARHRDTIAKLQLELNKALEDLKAREQTVKQLEGKQNKTIVEHVHVLEEAKRVTDRQLADAQAEIKKNAAYIRSLEKVKSRLTGEAEDLERLWTREKTGRIQEEKAARALADLEKEKQAKEAAELQCRKLQNELQNSQRQVLELTEELTITQISKNTLETELAELADDLDASNPLGELQRSYEKIAELESQLDNAEMVKVSVGRIKEHVDRHHDEIRRLIINGPADENFRSRLLLELQSSDDYLVKEFTRPISQMGRSTDERRSLPTVRPTKRPFDPEAVPQNRKAKSPATFDRQVSALKQHVQVLEVQIAASDRVRRHLEATIKSITTDLENSDGSKQSLQEYRTRLSKENAKLAELLEQEAQARHAAEVAQISGVQEMWNKFQTTISDERENYSKLEESRKALLIQQRTSQVDLEQQRRQIQGLTKSKQHLQSQVSELQGQLEKVKAEYSSAKHQLELRLSEQEISSSSVHSELRTALETYKTKAESFMDRLDAAEIASAKARRALADAERIQGELRTEKASSESQLQAAEERARHLASRFDEERRESSNMEILNKRLAEELEDEREQHQKDLAERDFTADQTRKKYQTELAQLSEELQSQRDNMSRLREDNRKIRSNCDELQLRYDDEVYNSGSWKKERERLETKVADINRAFEASTSAQAEQQSQIVSLHSQVRELRNVLSEAEADRALLQKARGALQAELEAIKLDHVETNKMSSDPELQKLQLKKQDLERSLEEQEDRVAMAFDRMKKAEAFANESQVELGRIRVENSDLERMNANLEKQIKEHNVRIVDLETKSYTNSSRPATISRRTESRIEELTNQLNQTSKEKNRRRDSGLQSAEPDRLRARLEEERAAYESQILSLRRDMDAMQTEGSDLRTAGRRAEREAADYKQKALNLAQEVERLRNRLERPSSSMLNRPPSGNSPRN